jgi:hypothetical protein
METKDLIYLWKVEDCNGVILDQLGVDGQGRKLEDVEKICKRPYTFYLIPQLPGLRKIAVKISGTKRFIYFRRINKKVSMMGCLYSGEQTVSVVYALGWQDTIEGKNVKSIMWIDSVTGEIQETGE